MELRKGCMGIPPALVRGPCAAGIDVRPAHFDVVCANVARSHETGLMVVRPTFIGNLRDEDEVLFVLRQYYVRFAVIDTRPDTMTIARLQESAGLTGVTMWRAQYNTYPGIVEIQENVQERIVKLDRTMTLDNVQHAFSTGLTVQLPQNFREILSQSSDGAWARQMTNSVRVPIEHQGKECYRWEKTGPDHGLHAFNLLLVAVKMSNLLAVVTPETMGATKGLIGEDRQMPKDFHSDRNVKAVAARPGLDWEAIERADDADGSMW